MAGVPRTALQLKEHLWLLILFWYLLQRFCNKPTRIIYNFRWKIASKYRFTKNNTNAICIHKRISFLNNFGWYLALLNPRPCHLQGSKGSVFVLTSMEKLFDLDLIITKVAFNAWYTTKIQILKGLYCKSLA